MPAVAGLGAIAGHQAHWCGHTGLPETVKQFQAVTAWHLKVGEYEIWLVENSPLVTIDSINSSNHLVIFKDTAKHFKNRRLIIYN